jgi:hypothetical protein
MALALIRKASSVASSAVSVRTSTVSRNGCAGAGAAAGVTTEPTAAMAAEVLNNKLGLIFLSPSAIDNSSQAAQLEHYINKFDKSDCL